MLNVWWSLYTHKPYSVSSKFPSSSWTKQNHSLSHHSELSFTVLFLQTPRNTSSFVHDQQWQTLSQGSLASCISSLLVTECPSNKLVYLRERICSEKFTCCHTEIEAADSTFHFTQSHYTDTRPTSPSTDPIMPGIWQGSMECQILNHRYDLTPERGTVHQQTLLQLLMALQSLE